MKQAHSSTHTHAHSLTHSLTMPSLALTLLFLVSYHSLTTAVPFSSKAALEGLSREALINLILGNTQSPTAPLTHSSLPSHPQSPPQSHSPTHPLSNNTTPSFTSNTTNKPLHSTTFPPLSSSNFDDKFYIYPLDRKYWWRWPTHDSSCTAHNQVGHNHALNSGRVCYIFTYSLTNLLTH